MKKIFLGSYTLGIYWHIHKRVQGGWVFFTLVFTFIYFLYPWALDWTPPCESRGDERLIGKWCDIFFIFFFSSHISNSMQVFGDNYCLGCWKHSKLIHVDLERSRRPNIGLALYSGMLRVSPITFLEDEVLIHRQWPTWMFSATQAFRPWGFSCYVQGAIALSLQYFLHFYFLLSFLHSTHEHSMMQVIGTNYLFTALSLKISQNQNKQQSIQESNFFLTINGDIWHLQLTHLEKILIKSPAMFISSYTCKIWSSCIR